MTVWAFAQLISAAMGTIDIDRSNLFRTVDALRFLDSFGGLNFGVEDKFLEKFD
jgi:hypothetical protein